MKAIISSLVLVFSFTARAEISCDPSDHMEQRYFDGVGVQTFYVNGECTFRVSLNNSAGNEQFFVSDLGKLSTVVISNQAFPTSTNSRSTGSRDYHLRPVVRPNISMSHDSGSNTLTLNLANGERMIIDTASQSIRDITGANWRRNSRGFREFRRGGQVIGEYVHDELDCINCTAVDPRLAGTQQTYRPAGLIIDSLENGVLTSTRFRRGGNPGELPDEYMVFRDRQGRECSIKNRYVYEYEYININGRQVVDSMKFKFPNEVDRVPTRNGALNENLAEFLARVCASKGIPNFDVSQLRPDGCPHCGTRENSGARGPTDDFLESFSDILGTIED